MRFPEVDTLKRQYDKWERIGQQQSAGHMLSAISSRSTNGAAFALSPLAVLRYGGHFLTRHLGGDTTAMRRFLIPLGLLWCAMLMQTVSLTAADNATPRELLQNAKTVVFLGDSITFAGQYVADIEAWMLAQNWPQTPKVINVGLPSETVSGLSEEGHADGKFPRPALTERLDRVLKVTQPNLVFACYGMNCGIYLPVSDERFLRYQQGIRELQQKVKAAGAQLILITPPTYDDQRKPLDFSYNAVLGEYSEWLLTLRGEGQRVIDLHGPMQAALQAERQTQPEFTYQPDAVHPNAAGQWLIARQILLAVGDDSVADLPTPEAMLTQLELPAGLLTLVRQRMAIQRDAYLSAAGHLRPGIQPGLPIEAAEVKAHELTIRIKELLPRPKL